MSWWEISRSWLTEAMVGKLGKDTGKKWYPLFADQLGNDATERRRKRDR